MRRTYIVFRFYHLQTTESHGNIFVGMSMPASSSMQPQATRASSEPDPFADWPRANGVSATRQAQPSASSTNGGWQPGFPQSGTSKNTLGLAAQTGITFATLFSLDCMTNSKIRVQCDPMLLAGDSGGSMGKAMHGMQKNAAMRPPKLAPPPSGVQKQHSVAKSGQPSSFSDSLI